MNKKGVFTLAILLMLGESVSAASNVEIIGKDNRYTVTAEAEGKATMIVAKKDSDINDNKNIVAVREGSSKNNQVSFVFEFAEIDDIYDGEYVVYIGDDATSEEKEFAHVSKAKKESAEIFLLNIVDKAELVSALKPESEYKLAFMATGVDFECYNLLNDKQKEAVAELFIKEKSDDIINNLNKAIGITMINNNIFADKALECINAEFGEEKYLDSQDDNLKEWLQELMPENATYSDFESFDTTYEFVNILYKFRVARFSDFESLFEEYGEILGISVDSYYNAYKNLPANKKAEVGENLVIMQTNNSAKTTGELSEYLKNAYLKLNSSSSGSNGSGGGGSSSGTSVKNQGNKGAVVTGDVVDITSKTEEKEIIEFEDIDSVEWAAEAINILAKKNIISGMGDNKFAPNEPVTREQFVKMIIEAMGIYDKNAVCGFEDTLPGEWHHAYIATAVNAKIASGISDSSFGTGRALTRQEMAVFAKRAINQYKEIKFIREPIEFSDKDFVAEYAIESVNEMYRAGIMSGTGDNCFEPLAVATRAQAAVVIYNLFVR